MRANRRKLEIAMANSCMRTKDLQMATGMPMPTVHGVITGRNVRQAESVGSQRHSELMLKKF